MPITPPRTRLVTQLLPTKSSLSLSAANVSLNFAELQSVPLSQTPGCRAIEGKTRAPFVKLTFLPLKMRAPKWWAKIGCEPVRWSAVPNSNLESRSAWCADGKMPLWSASGENVCCKQVQNVQHLRQRTKNNNKKSKKKPSSLCESHTHSQFYRRIQPA